MEEYKLSAEYVDQLIKSFGAGLVGKIMKRMEISSNLPEIKQQIKNLVHEEMRTFKQLLDAHAAGYHQVQWEFKNQKGKE